MKLESKVSLVKLLNHLAESAPKMLKKGDPKFDPTALSFLLGKELAAEFLSAMNDLRLELVPRHAEDRDILNAFWDDLVCEVNANGRVYIQEPQALAMLVDEFGILWKQPLSEHEMLYSIDHLAVGQDPIILSGVEFFEPTDQALVQRGIPRAEVAGWGSSDGTSTMARVRVHAASCTTASRVGRDQVTEAVTFMRVAALRGLVGKTLTDELLQWKLTGHYLARQVILGEPSRWSYGFQRQFGPLVTGLGKYIQLGAARLGLEELKEELPEDIRHRVLQSGYWISHSTTHEADDHKLVDLCTALEILLLPEGKRIYSKGAVIALRYNVLGGDLNPTAVKWMYDRRNDVVHGNPLPIVGETDIWELRWVCYTTVALIVRASKDNPYLSSLQDLFDKIETEERLKSFVELAEKGIYEGSQLPSLVKEARSKLKKL